MDKKIENFKTIIRVIDKKRIRKEMKSIPFRLRNLKKKQQSGMLYYCKDAHMYGRPGGWAEDFTVIMFAFNGHTYFYFIKHKEVVCIYVEHGEYRWMSINSFKFIDGHQEKTGRYGMRIELDIQMDKKDDPEKQYSQRMFFELEE